MKGGNRGFQSLCSFAIPDAIAPYNSQNAYGVSVTLLFRNTRCAGGVPMGMKGREIPHPHILRTHGIPGAKGRLKETS